MLTISGIDVFRGETQVLWNVSLEVARGERVAILGSNGAGKSSLMGAVTGVLPSRSGEIHFNGASLVGLKPHRVARMGISLVPEGRRVYGDMTVHENLEMGAFPARGRKQAAETMAWVLELFPVLAARRKQRAGTLSGGEQQMLAIGRALMNRPELLLVDELSLGLAPLITKEIYSALDRIGHETTVVLVEQNVEMALKHSARGYVLESGRVTHEGASKDLLSDPEVRRAYLGM